MAQSMTQKFQITALESRKVNPTPLSWPLCLVRCVGVADPDNMSPAGQEGLDQIQVAVPKTLYDQMVIGHTFTVTFSIGSSG